MTKIKNPYLTVINKYTKYSPKEFKDFEYKEIDVNMGDWFKKTALIEKETYKAYQRASLELESIGAECTLNSAGRTRFDQIYTKIEKFAGVLKSSKSIKKAFIDTKSETARIGYSEHLSCLALDIKISVDNMQIPYKLKELYPQADIGTLKFLTKRLIMEKNGFILSYPTSPRLKEVTGVSKNEVWHWRYIGAEHAQMIGKLREKVSKILNRKEEVFLEDYVKLLEMDITANNEKELIEQYADHFIKDILKFENTEELKV